MSEFKHCGNAHCVTCNIRTVLLMALADGGTGGQIVPVVLGVMSEVIDGFEAVQATVEEVETLGAFGQGPLH